MLVAADNLEHELAAKRPAARKVSGSDVDAFERWALSVVPEA